MSSEKKGAPREPYSRREALAAMMKYSAAVGGSAVTILSADALVSAASAYPLTEEERLARFCANNPTHWKCTTGSSSSGRVKF